ncbi:MULTISPECIES: extradiol ring-cleavage dioxygenase [unclassified Sinorhizobium]|uniref:DODA-type extradiol aromatic ring-opening family dioxygenase n=1 Tax=unclassified Sinorhizobium TaxID=2613772 RepID=UPI0024C45213|nr:MULTISPECIES: extradiol ring-cleavage dioxygenase [unclassified Sinorhizobium]MDK1374742.1 extradiol ring-cleavage dioxygenase [Sinorhizobium sp. 6-70]MDK1479075.1 extradiol ring-cleavage dioxygenase [Sinorhizobium sp. 6-117]
MARLVATLASTHHPFYLKATTAPPEEQMPQAPEWKRKVEAYRETLTGARPDILVMIGSDHFHQIFLDNYPQFLIGKASWYDATFYNEEREFGIPSYKLSGDEDMSRFLHQSLLAQDFDLAFSNELKIDHSIVCPIITVRPQNDLPIVPIYTNIFAPPLPSPRRFLELGRAIRKAIEDYPSDKRVAAIGTGHLSLELGGPRQFMEAGPDPEFDRQAIDWLRTGNIGAILASVTHESLEASGNATHGFLNFILMLGVAGAAEADYVDYLDLFHTMEAYFTWFPKEAVR